jgi:archaellum component FlaC
MSVEQLERIESAVTRIESTVGQVQADVAGLKTDVAGLKTDVAGLKTDVARLDAGYVDLGREMRALHEEVIQRIADTVNPLDDFERMLKREIGELKESIERRLYPLELVVKSHSAEIADLQRSRDAR